MSRKTVEIPVWRRELWSPDECGAMFGVSRSTWYELHRLELIPLPAAIRKPGQENAPVRWRAAELRAWCAAGMPRRAHWRWKPYLAEVLDQRVDRLRAELNSLTIAIGNARSEMNDINQSQKVLQ